jgi:hypothetical protein
VIHALTVAAPLIIAALIVAAVHRHPFRAGAR